MSKIQKTDHFYLIDGSGYIFRAYYALPPMQKKDGTPVNAVFGFTNMLVKLIEDYYQDKIIVIFDAARENFRNSIYKDYKANRGETPEDLIPQFDLIRKCVDSFDISQIEMEGYEADDIIASFAKIASSKNINSLIVSSDPTSTKAYSFPLSVRKNLVYTASVPSQSFCKNILPSPISNFPVIPLDKFSSN